MSARSLLVVGSVAVDDIDGPYGWQRDQLGGSASFIGVAASYFTPHTSIVAVVGEDFDEEHIKLFRGRGIDVSGIERRAGKTFRWVGRYAPDLTRDRVHVWLSKYHWLPLTIVGFLQLGIGAALAPTGHRIAGAVGMMLWGTFLRVCLGLHATWLVNSATHMFGSRRFETKDDSRNSWWVALLTGGEGWHNNHHAHPVSARHGLAWYELDVNYYGIWFLSKIGLAEKVQVAKFDPKNPKPAGA